MPKANYESILFYFYFFTMQTLGIKAVKRSCFYQDMQESTITIFSWIKYTWSTTSLAPYHVSKRGAKPLYGTGIVLSMPCICWYGWVLKTQGYRSVSSLWRIPVLFQIGAALNRFNCSGGWRARASLNRVELLGVGWFRSLHSMREILAPGPLEYI